MLMKSILPSMCRSSKAARVLLIWRFCKIWMQVATRFGYAAASTAARSLICKLYINKIGTGEQYMRKKRNNIRFLSCLIAIVLIAGLGMPHPSQQAMAAADLPTASEIVQTLKSIHPDKGHPRILATADDFASIKQNITTDTFANQIYQQVKTQANAVLSKPLPAYSSSLLSTSRSVLADIRTLGMVAQIEDGSDKAPYVNKAWSILQAAGNFANWNPSHFLDVAEMTMAFAIGYDWFYHEWTEEQKTFIQTAIVTKGLQPAKQAYQKGYSADAAWWANVNFNWNTVVNGGISNGALAIADESPEIEALAGELLELALAHVQKVLPTFAPDGGGEEGSGYWEYNNQYFVFYAASLFAALGTDYGLTDAPGVSETAYFPIHIAGTNGSFNYGDNYTEVVKDPLFLWYASRFDNDDFSKYWLSHLTSGTTPEALDLLWYKPEMASDSYRLDLNLDQLYEGVNVGTMRSSWYDPYALFAAIKGGDNMYNHSHLDMGTFVMDALGVRWAQDLGPDSYSLPNYFELVSGRSQYYRERTEGHNTIVLNPGFEDGQYYRSSADIVRSGSAPDQAFYITDLSDAYAAHATKVERGMALNEHRRQFLLQDEVKMKAPGEFYWFMHTRADIAIEDGGQSAVLTMGNKKLWAHILTPDAGLSFSVRDPLPLPVSQNPGGQTANAGSKLTIRGTGVEDLTLAVLFVPLLDWEQPPVELPEVQPLAEWSVPIADTAELNGITIDGVALEGLRPDKYTYYVQWTDASVMPVIAANSAEAGDAVNVQLPEMMPGVVHIQVEPSDPSARAAEYRIVFDLPFNPYASVLASSHDGNIPENTLDGNLATRWSASGQGQWIQYKLTEEQVIDKVKMAFYNGHQRATVFDILLSSDGINWTEVYSGQSSGTTQELETFGFEPRMTRYIRIVGYGNTVNEWNSISEVDFNGKPTVAPPDQFASVEAALSNGTLPIDSSAQLNVTARMKSGALVNLNEAEVKYFTADPSIAQINEQGIVTGIGYGDVKVWAEVTVAGHTKVGIAELTVDDGSMTVYPTDDAHVRGGSFAGNNYGNASTFELKGDNMDEYAREGYMKFDLASITAPVESAKLLINAAVSDAGATNATLGIYAATGAWSEGTVTWNTKPQVSELLNTVTLTKQFAWHEVDITEYVQDQLGTGGIVNLALLQNPNNVDGIGYVSNVRTRQHSSQKPNLRITLAQDSSPITASAANNQILVSPASVVAGNSVTITAVGDRQSAAGKVPGDERYIPVGWTSTEVGKSGAFVLGGAGYTSNYTPSTAGSYTIAADFKLQTWDGEAWVDTVTEPDAKTTSLSVTAAGTVMKLSPTGDGYVRGGTYSDDNFGSGNELEVKHDSLPNYTREGYMKFDISSLDQPILSAKLFVNGIVTDADSATLGVYRAVGDWSEGDLTWNTKPEHGALINTATITNTYQWHEIDLTAYVQEQYAAQGIVNLALLQNLDPNSRAIRLRTLQHSSQKPYLEIVLQTAAGEGYASIQANENERSPGQSVEWTIGVGEVSQPFTAFDVILHYDPQMLAFETNQQGEVAVLSEDSLESANDHYAVSSAVREDLGQIRLLYFTSGNQHAITGSAPLFKLIGEIKADAAVNESMTVWLSDAEVSFEDTGYSLNVEMAAATVHIVQQTVDKQLLSSAVTEAVSLYNQATVGTQPGQYPESTKSIFDLAIKSATAVLDQADATQSAVDQAVADLNTAIQQFLASVIAPNPADLTLLNAVIVKAQNMYNKAKVGDKIGEYPEAARSALNTKLITARGVRDSASPSEWEVAAAVDALEQALSQFASQIITLTPGATKVGIRDLSIIAQYFGIDAEHEDWDKVAAADIDDTGVISIETLARVARMILDEWATEL